MLLLDKRMSLNKVNKELLEKYHLGFCTAEERQIVETWLFNTETDNLNLPKSEIDLHQKEMWDNIKGVFDDGKPQKSQTYYMWKGAIAASLVLFTFGLIVYLFLAKDTVSIPDPLSINNIAQSEVQHISAVDYNISIGPNTNAQINHAGIIDLSGSVLISPKENISLTFKGTDKKVILKKGQSYIILKGEAGTQGIIVISERNLMDLPPIMQKQISAQFGI